ncbi:exopolysaccharide biosynthesis polyprenyl glycosylphosphotransferase [Azospirillum sp. sgz301742]
MNTQADCTMHDVPGREAEAPGERFLAPVQSNKVLATAVLVAGDILVLELSIAFGTLLRILASSWFPIGIGPSIFLGVHAAVFLLPLGYCMAGLYPGYGQTEVERLRSRTIVTGLSFGAMVLFDYLAQDGKWSRGILLSSAMIALVVSPVWDVVARRLLIRLKRWGAPVAVWGAADRRAAVIEALRENHQLGWVPVLEGDWPVPGKLPPADIEVALLVLPRTGSPALALADELPYRRVMLVPDVSNVQSLWVSVRDLGTYLGLETRRNLLAPFNRIVKRAMDVVLSCVALVPALPILAVFALVVVVASPGPAFFVQTRTGLDGRPFRMWKLRTMVPDATERLAELFASLPSAEVEWKNHMKLRADPRVIPFVGRLIRRFSVDELPQLWNVIRGDMSLVGPRPLPSYHLAVLDPAANRLRQSVRPGLTGLWQVAGRSSRPLAEQQRLDTYYVRNWSIWLDIHILACTVVAVLRGKGAW